MDRRHPEAAPTIPALLDKANLSACQIARAFSAEIRVSPRHYVDRVRLDDTDAGIEEPAKTSGFGR